MKWLIELLKKWACIHKWKTHAKKKYGWDQEEIVKGTEYWFNPIVEVQHYTTTEEVLICKRCGAIKHITY